MPGYQVIARRYRPQTFSAVLGQEATVTTLKNAIKQNLLAHAYLFCGSRGTGKTTLARVFAKALNCQQPTADGEPCNECSSCRDITSGQSLDVIEIDGASHRGIDDVRQINDTVAFAPSSGKFKIYIIDEVHMLTKEAFNALLKTLEEPPDKVKFFFATTEAHKVLPTILSRCQRFNLNRIPMEKLIQKLLFIANEQNRPLDLSAARIIASRAEGAFRDAESLLDQIFAFHEGAVTAETVTNVLGLMPREALFKLDLAGKNHHLSSAFEIVDQLFSQGKDLSHFIETLTDHFRTLLLMKLSGKDAPFLDLSDEERGQYEASVPLYTKEQCMTAIELLVEAQTRIRFSPSPRIALEALLLKIIQLQQRVSIDFLLRRLQELENSVLTASPVAQPVPVSHKPANPEISKPAIESTILSPALTDPVHLPELKPMPIKIEHAKEELVSAPAKPELSITIDPTPSTADIGIVTPAKKSYQQPEKPAPKAAVAATSAQRPNDIKKQSQLDTLLQFTAIELEGSLKINPIGGV